MFADEIDKWRSGFVQIDSMFAPCSVKDGTSSY